MASGGGAARERGFRVEPVVRGASLRDMIPCLRRAAQFMAMTAVLGPALTGQEAVNSTPVTLPDFNVYGERELPPAESWLYARIDGFEVLSNASASRTADLATELQRYAYALNLVWPGARPTGPAAALVICGADRQFDAFLPADLRGGERAFTTFHRRGREFSALVLDEQTRTLSLAMDEVATTTTAPAATGGSSDELESETTEAGVDVGFQIDPQQQLLRQYVHYVLAGLNPPPAPWLAEGLAQLCGNLRITTTEISLGRVENPNETTAGRTDRDFNAALANKALLPMAELFAVAPGSATASNPLDNRWAKQCYAFVHWGLYGDLGRNQKNFIRFLVRADREGLSEKLFQECFQQDYAAMLQTLRTHIEQTRSKVGGVRAAPGEKIPWPPKVEVRAATEAEIARLKSEVFTLTGQPERAREALILAYRRGERDADLLGQLGLAELAAGETARARRFLEAAARAQSKRPRAYLALARLRFDERLARPQAGDGRLSYEQLLGVLEPLLAARQLTPRLPETYELFATAWSRCATPPPAPHLAVVDEGLKLFPDHAALRAARAALDPR